MADDPTFEQLIAEGESVPVAGWDFSWFEGRAFDQLAEMHERILSRGPFVSHAQRFLIEARKPG